MKLIVLVVAALVAVALSSPVDQVPLIVRSEFKQSPEGGYNFNFETDNGIKKEENGEIKTVNDADNKPQQVVVVRGSYSWVGEDKQEHSVNYVADENGFKPVSDDIPHN